MKRLLLVLMSLLLGVATLEAQEKVTKCYARHDTSSLYLDVYQPQIIREAMPCVVYIFGGGFVGGVRDDDYARRFCNRMTDNGFVAVAIDYRLGMKGVKNPGVFNYKPVKNAIDMAAEDALLAIDYLVDNAEELHISPDSIMLVGSSAGAITALQTDYYIANEHAAASVLPDDFRLAGVVAYSGAIFSTKGKLKYKNTPAPTMMFHGTRDKLVPYKQIKFFNIGFFGSDKIVDRFRSYDFPFFVRRYQGFAHGVAMFFDTTVDDILWFYETYVRKGQRLQVDECRYDLDGNRPASDDISADDLYN